MRPRRPNGCDSYDRPESASMTAEANKSELELEDIQSIIVGAYGGLRAASYLMLTIKDAERARAWVGDLSGRVRHAKQGPPKESPSVNVAFTLSGLQKLQLAEQALRGFSRELQEGMWDNERRRRILGDQGGSDPDLWKWGGPKKTAIDVLLLLFAKDGPGREALVADESRLLQDGGLEVIERIDSSDLGAPKEHFGFRDGISQPRLAGVTSSTDEAHVVADGEFILGYPNGYKQFTTRPLVDPIHDPDQILPDDVCGSHQRDFGRNGSYLVFRQLEQDVQGFWEFVDKQAETADGSNEEARERLAAKMVGRWRGGAPLAKAPDADDPELSTNNDFRYHHEDADGLKCPVGAHVRRSNPRDSLLPKPGTSESIDVNKRHRILRRGRTYGPPLAASLEPEDFLRESRALREGAGDGGNGNASRGLLFLCLNANIGRQFEFVQNMWVNNPNFDGLYTEPDPLIGYRRSSEDSFSIPAEPVRQTLCALPTFVNVVGGAYFFLPGLRSLRFLARPPKPLATPYSAPAPAAGPAKPALSVRLMQLATRLLQGTMMLFRRQPFAMVRNLLDAVFRPLVVSFTQFLINIRRHDEGLELGEERLLPREDELARRITGSMTHFLYKHYRKGVAERAGNTKTYGFLRARFIVAEDLAEELSVGVFQPRAEYPAYVRLGGPGPLVTPDIRNNGILSIGVKLMGVEGAKLSDDESHTQDFSGISAPTFTTPDAIENLKLQKHIYQETEAFYFINPFDSHYLDAVMQGLYSKSHGSPLDLRYWSCVPYAFGEGRAFQYSFVPTAHKRSKVPWSPSDNYLREAMVKLLAEEAVEFDFMIQLQTDADRMPIENASVIWPESYSPWIRVAKLHIPAQRFDSEQQLAFARQISVNPWHCVAEHRPLGNQNRARRYVYLETSKVRQRINAEPRVEPTGDEEFV